MTDFAVGDRVEYTYKNGDLSGPRAGDIGTVVRIINVETMVGVQFDSEFRGGHSAGWCGEDGRCWYCCNGNLKLIKEDEFDELSDAEIIALI